MRNPVQIARFAVVGVAVAALYVLLYLAFLHLGLAQPVANASAFLLAIAFQYLAQARFTFAAPLNDRPQIIRFAVMISAGLITSALITGWIGPALALPDWAAAVAVTLILPIQNFLLMSRWVFAPAQKPETSS